ncbi:MAG TPA: hypothetical protein DCZ94_19720 [Lentisphaeria bacterium]|nr:MAG: hypothetical protein A2X48_22440 [Lentisphaerae bacterium GWF2_49_21]HBC89174.1 hypothetical protein [Lentisphaeria bacterium]
MKKIFAIALFAMLAMDLWSLDTENGPQPFEYFQPNIYANMFNEKSNFVEVPAATGAVIGDIVGIAGGYPLGIVLGMPISCFTDSVNPMDTGMYWGWLCIGLPVRSVSAQAVSAPFFMLKSIFWDFPIYCFKD